MFSHNRIGLDWAKVVLVAVWKRDESTLAEHDCVAVAIFMRELPINIVVPIDCDNVVVSGGPVCLIIVAVRDASEAALLIHVNDGSVVKSDAVGRRG